MALTLCRFGICDGVPLLSPTLYRNLSAVLRLDSSKSVDPVN